MAGTTGELGQRMVGQGIESAQRDQPRGKQCRFGHGPIVLDPNSGGLRHRQRVLANRKGRRRTRALRGQCPPDRVPRRCRRRPGPGKLRSGVVSIAAMAGTEHMLMVVDLAGAGDAQPARASADAISHAPTSRRDLRSRPRARRVVGRMPLGGLSPTAAPRPRSRRCRSPRPRRRYRRWRRRRRGPVPSAVLDQHRAGLRDELAVGRWPRARRRTPADPWRARSARARRRPCAIDAHALPVAMSMRNMLAPSWRWALRTWPASSSTTTRHRLVAGFARSAAGRGR